MRKSLREHQEDWIVVSAETDFGLILAAQKADHPSLVLVREPNLLVAPYLCDMLIPALGTLAPGLSAHTTTRYGRERTRNVPGCPVNKKAPRQ
jgi:hypothetical protein